MLAEQWRGTADRRRRDGGAHGEVQHARGAVAGLLDLGDHLEMLDLRVGEDLVELVDGSGRDRRALEALEPLGGGGAGQRRLDAGAEVVVMDQPRVVGGEPRIAGEGGVAQRRAEALVLVGVHHHDLDHAIPRRIGLGRRQVGVAVAHAPGPHAGVEVLRDGVG